MRLTHSIPQAIGDGRTNGREQPADLAGSCPTATSCAHADDDAGVGEALPHQWISGWRGPGRRRKWEFMEAAKCVWLSWQYAPDRPVCAGGADRAAEGASESNRGDGAVFGQSGGRRVWRQEEEYPEAATARSTGRTRESNPWKRPSPAVRR